MELLKLLVIIINYFHFINSAHNSFKNECGPFQGLENSFLIPKKDDCVNTVVANPNTYTCCYVEGEKNLIKRTACVLIQNNEDERIKLVQDLSEIATRIKVDCGQQKVFNSDCGINGKKEKNDCFNDPNTDKCCFVKISSSQFEGQGCKLFDSISLNDIGEAVVAAKTVDADLEVECGSCFLNINFITYIFMIIFFIYNIII